MAIRIKLLGIKMADLAVKISLQPLNSLQQLYFVKYFQLVVVGELLRLVG